MVAFGSAKRLAIVLIALIWVITGCARSGTADLPVGSVPANRSNRVLPGIIDDTVDQSQRDLVSAVINGVPPVTLAQISQSTRIGVVVVDAVGNVMASATNRASFQVSQVQRDGKRPDGIVDPSSKEHLTMTSFNSNYAVSNRIEREPDAQIVPLESTSTGPYRHVYPSGIQSYNGMAAQVTLPCESSSAIAANETAYVYLGGDGNINTQAADGQYHGYNIESGLQYSTSFQNYTPYIRLHNVSGGTSTRFFELKDVQSNADTKNSYGAYGSYYNAAGPSRFWCNSLAVNPAQTVSLNMGFNVLKAQDYTGDGKVGTEFVNIEIDQKSGSGFILALLVSNTLPNGHLTTGSGGDYPFGGFGDPCTGCVMLRTTAIAQNGGTYYDQSHFGPVKWTNVEYSNDSYIYNAVASACTENPSWSGTTSDCSNTPILTSNKSVLVENYSTTSAEDVSINMYQLPGVPDPSTIPLSTPLPLSAKPLSHSDSARARAL